MDSNLICSKCGTDYYSASPNQAVETLECDNGCGLTLVRSEDYKPPPHLTLVENDD